MPSVWCNIYHEVIETWKIEELKIEQPGLGNKTIIKTN